MKNIFDLNYYKHNCQYHFHPFSLLKKLSFLAKKLYYWRYMTIRTGIKYDATPLLSLKKRCKYASRVCNYYLNQEFWNIVVFYSSFWPKYLFLRALWTVTCFIQFLATIILQKKIVWWFFVLFETEIIVSYFFLVPRQV